MTPDIQELLAASQKARQATIAAQMARDEADRRYRAAMAEEAAATRALSNARTALDRGKPLNA